MKDKSTASQPSIWIVNDEECVLHAQATALRHRFPQATLRMFQGGVAAWDALQQGQPDLLITDDAMPALRGQELAERLHARGVTFPVLVNSPYAPSQEWVDALASRGMRIQMLALPMELGDFWDCVAKLLGEP